jgi:Leucine-rich repeat (LRR) protein
VLGGCQKKERSFKDEAMEIVEDHQRQTERENEETLENNDYAEGVQEVLEWFNYKTAVAADYKPIVIYTRGEYDQLVKNNPGDVTALFLDFRSNREEAKVLDIKRIKDFKNLEYLETLGFDRLPIEIYTLQKLRLLHTNSELDSIDAIVNLKELEEFEALWTDNILPTSITELTKLKTLRISGANQRNTSDIFDLPNLESLWIDFNDAEQLNGISKLKKLKCLITNKVTKEVGELPALKGLNLSGSYDLEFPAELAKLQSLVAFAMHSNHQIEKAPTFTGRLKNLEYIEFRGCESLIVIPDSYNELGKLKTFNIFYNKRIREVPANLDEIRKTIEVRNLDQ